MATFTPNQSILKIKQYCAYQERCHSEVKTRLYSYGLTTPEVDEIVMLLINENYLNEERFAIQFAGGKFRMKQWGKNKIIQALKFKQISDYCIRKAIRQIEDADYYRTFYKLAETKINSLRSEKNQFIKKRKVQDFLLRKGYETHLIAEVLKDI